MRPLAAAFVTAVLAAAFPACGGGDDDAGERAAPASPTAVRGDREIAFVRFAGRRNDRHGDVFAMRADGSGPLNLTRTPRVAESAPAWSPDGTRIAFAREEAGWSDIWVMDADGGNPVNITNTPRASEEEPAWAPDGETIAYSLWDGSSSDLWSMEPDGSAQANLTGTADADEFGPAWSPDGERLVFQSAAQGDPPDFLAVEDTVTMARDGSGRRVITGGARFAGLYVQAPVFTADGERILFLGLKDGARHPLVWAMTAAGRAPAPLRGQPRASLSSPPAPSPDGRWIAYGGVGDGPGIYVMRADGSGRRRLPGGRVNDQAPAWQPPAPGGG